MYLTGGEGAYFELSMTLALREAVKRDLTREMFHSAEVVFGAAGGEYPTMVLNILAFSRIELRP